MSKMSELDICVGELRNAAQSLNAVADSLASLIGGNTLDDSVSQESMVPAPTPKPITLEQVRAVLAEKSRDGYTTKIRELLEKHGASKLSEIDPVEYAAMLKEAEALNG